MTQTVFVKVSVKDRLPDETDTHYLTNEGYVVFTDNGKWIYRGGWSDDILDVTEDVEWWLEERQLPSDNEIEENGVEGGLTDNELQMFWEGGVWLRNYILIKQK